MDRLVECNSSTHIHHLVVVLLFHQVEALGGPVCIVDLGNYKGRMMASSRGTSSLELPYKPFVVGNKVRRGNPCLVQYNILGTLLYTPVHHNNNASSDKHHNIVGICSDR